MSRSGARPKLEVVASVGDQSSDTVGVDGVEGKLEVVASVSEQVSDTVGGHAVESGIRAVAGAEPQAAGRRSSKGGAEQLFWQELRSSTQARIGLGRTGDALPTAQVLEFRAAHSAARDAVHQPLDVEDLAARVRTLGIGAATEVSSMANGRAEYLRRPDLGRLPAAEALAAVPHSGADIGFVLADGLSPRALTDHGPAMLAALIDELSAQYSIAAPVIATQSRVALADHIAEAMGVQTVVVLIGERPGLSVADSLGLYLTHLPYPGRTDADRNCVSNIHPPEGLGYTQAAKVVSGLIFGAHRLGRSGVDLKDTSRADTLGSGEGNSPAIDLGSGEIHSHATDLG